MQATLPAPASGAGLPGPATGEREGPMRRIGRIYLSILRPRADRGATIVEYVVLVSGIAMLIAASLTLLGADLQAFFGKVTSLWP